MKKEAEQVKVINKKNGQIRWFAAHLAHDERYMNQVGFILSEVEEIKPLPVIEIPKEEIKEVAEDIVDEFLQDSKPKKGRKPNKQKLN